jgi:hypothetical protein
VHTTLGLDALEPLMAMPVGSITVVSQNTLLRRAVREGRGVFVEELQRQLARRRIDVPFLSHDLIAELNGQQSSVRIEEAEGSPPRDQER